MDPIGDRGIGNITDWLSGLARRREAVAQNIANIDTPGYRRKTVSFESELRRSTQPRSGSLNTTNPAHISTPSLSNQSLLGAQGSQELVSSRRDGNNVDIDQEMIELAETQLRYQTATRALSTKLQTLRDVLRSL
jgi:flagellar basal-body rod protein FlgB